MNSDRIDCDELRAELVEGRFQPSTLAFMTDLPEEKFRKFLQGDNASLATNELQQTHQVVCLDEKTLSEKLKEWSHTMDAVGIRLRKHTIGYIYADSKGAFALASGTLIEVEGRYFVATTRHSIRQSLAYQFVGGNETFIRGDPTANGIEKITGGTNVNILKYGKHTDYDVGYFEIDSQSVEVLQREPIKMDHILRNSIYGKTTFVIGCPSGLIKPMLRSPKTGELPMATFLYPDVLLSPQEWPNVPHDSRSPSSDVDCFMDYHMSQSGKLVPMGKCDTIYFDRIDKNVLPDAPGMSGGGFWQSKVPKGAPGPWTPDSYCLIAIQSAWSKREAYLRGIGIAHWLDLICKDYPSLRDAISLQGE